MKNLLPLLRLFPALQELEVLRSLPDFGSVIQALLRPDVSLIEIDRSPPGLPSPKKQSWSIVTCPMTSAHTVAIDFDKEDIIAAGAILSGIGTGLRHLVIRLDRGALEFRHS